MHMWAGLPVVVQLPCFLLAYAEPHCEPGVYKKFPWPFNPAQPQMISPGRGGLQHKGVRFRGCARRNVKIPSFQNTTCVMRIFNILDCSSF